GELPHQRVVGVLAEGGGDRAGIETGQLRRGPGAALAEAAGETGGDGEEAAVAGALADRRPPAGAEVDRVEADREGGALLAAGAGDRRRRVGALLGGSRRGLELRRVGVNRPLLDVDVAGAAGHPGAGRAHLVSYQAITSAVTSSKSIPSGGGMFAWC